jgi:hypothetical protein
LAVVWKPTPTADWTAFELPGFRDESVLPHGFAADNQSVLFTGVRAGEKWAALYRLDLASKSVERVFAFDNTDVRAVMHDFAGNDAIGVVGYTDKPVHAWLNKDNNGKAVKAYSALYRALAGQSVVVTSASDDGRLAIVFADSDINPGDYYVFNTETLKADYLQPARKHGAARVHFPSKVARTTSVDRVAPRRTPRYS